MVIAYYPTLIISPLITFSCQQIQPYIYQIKSKRFFRIAQIVKLCTLYIQNNKITRKKKLNSGKNMATKEEKPKVKKAKTPKKAAKKAKTPKKDAKKAKTPKKASKNPSKKAEHPPSAVMVLEAVKALKEKDGSSLAAIKKHITANYKV